MISRRFFFAAAAGLLLSLSFGRPAVAGDQDPRAFVVHLADKAMEIMTVKGATDQDRVTKFRILFANDVDIPEISKFVLGRYWRLSSPEQQQEFIRSFEEILVLTWSARFKDYGGDLRHTVTNVSPDGDLGVMVDSLVDRQRQQPIALQWRLRRDGGGGLRVTDLVVEGSSMAITYRSEYAAVIQANGGKVEGLLSALRAKLAELQAGGSSSTKAD